MLRADYLGLRVWITWVFAACRFAPIVETLAKAGERYDPRSLRVYTKQDLSRITHEAAEDETKKDAAYVLQPHLRDRFRANGGLLVLQVDLHGILEKLTGAQVHAWNKKTVVSGLHCERVQQFQVQWYVFVPVLEGMFTSCNLFNFSALAGQTSDAVHAQLQPRDRGVR
jgi:hypothetical protein